LYEPRTFDYTQPAVEIESFNFAHAHAWLLKEKNLEENSRLPTPDAHALPEFQ
jgi:hypothetical protein